MKILELPEAWRVRAIVIREAARDWFTREELAQANVFRLPKRREEWMHARIAAKQLAVERGICSDPRACRVARPTLIVGGERTEWHVSISHSHPYAAAAIDRAPVGIDVETVRDLRESAAHLFLSDEEAEAMRACRIAHRILHFWAAKEAAWKQRSSEFATLKKVPLTVVNVSRSGILFDVVETLAIGDVIVAVTNVTRDP